MTVVFSTVRLLRLVVLTLLLSVSQGAFAQSSPRPPADAWATNYVQFPAGVATNQIFLTGFEKLQADAIAGKLKIVWPVAVNTNSTVTLWVSADEAGHWPARDWQPYAMRPRATLWESAVPIDNVDIPIFYFIAVKTGTEPQRYSLMRVCHPRLAGLEEPSRIFWPFLEGFEEDTSSWSVVTDAAEPVPIQIDPLAKHGKAALLATLPAGKRSITVATTCVRGWQIEQNFANGLRLWVRTREGTGKLRFTLFSNASTPKQALSIFPEDITVKNQWQLIELPFKSFPKLILDDLDLFTIEFIGVGPMDFLVDSLEYTGRWKPSGN